MNNKKIWLGMLVIVLVFGMTAGGCDNDPTDSNGETHEKRPDTVFITQWIDDLSDPGDWQAHWTSIVDLFFYINKLENSKNYEIKITGNLTEAMDRFCVRLQGNTGANKAWEPYSEVSSENNIQSGSFSFSETVTIDYGKDILIDQPGNIFYLSILNPGKRTAGLGEIVAIIRDFSLEITESDVNPSNKPENHPDSWRWWTSSADDGTATINSSIDDNGLNRITVGGTPGSNIWDASAGYSYTAVMGNKYEYTFIAYTESGERDIRIEYYGDNESETYLNLCQHITSEETEYSFVGDLIPLSGIDNLIFQCANMTGTFFVKIISIEITESD